MGLELYTDITECLKLASTGDKRVIIAYSEQETHSISYRDLWELSCCFSEKMKRQNVQHQEKVFICCSKLESMVYALWTCAVGGYIAIPIAYSDDKAMDWSRFERFGAASLITDIKCQENKMFSRVFDISGIEDEERQDIPRESVSYSPEDIFCIQFSSGTTGMSKGIPIKRKNIYANLKDEMECFQVNEDDIVLNWQPLSHSGGLIIFHLMAVAANLNQYLISEKTYIQNPLIWMNLIHKYRATITGTIPFAVRHFMAFMDNTGEKPDWDLSCLKVITLGAEHVGIDLLKKFVSKMEPYRLKRGAVTPTYGLSEATCLIGYGINNGTFDTYMMETKEFVYGGKVIRSTDTNYMPEYISYSRLGSSTQFGILDEAGNSLSIGEIGNIWIKGPSVIDGYMIDGGEIDDSSQRDGWINTGDLGAFIKPGELAIMGRTKEIVVLGGENYECAALEKLATSISRENGFREAIVCNIIQDDGLEFLGVFVLCENYKKDAPFMHKFSELQKKIRDGLYNEFRIVIEVIVPIGEIPRSSSGKIRRIDLAAKYKSKEYEVMEKLGGMEVGEENRPEKGNVAEKIVCMIDELFHIKISDINKNFREYGIVSVNIPVLINEINKEFGTDIKVTSVFNYPDLASFIKYVSKMADSADGYGDKRDKKQSGFRSEDEIAIVGMSCRFPDGANDPEQYWNLLFQGMDAMVDIPKERWDWEKYYSEDKDEAGKMYCKKGGFLNIPIDEFDAKFFNISPKEAVELDPHHRMLMELTWEAFENGGMDITQYSGTRTGVYLGIASDEYSQATVSSGNLESIGSYSLTGVCDSTACGRLSYTFGFEGPCFSVDTACSSSLTALHLACNSIKNDDADVAVVGGCSLIISPAISIAFSKLKATSPDGHCKSFDASANGYGRGEGGGVIILKRLSEAIEDHDQILGIIKGSGLNQDGKSNGLTAPNGESQRKLIEQTLQKYEIDAEAVSYIETHGTGTVLGDPIEVNALMEAYCKEREGLNPLRIGSVKSNMGHLEAASGMASIIKVLLSMKNDMIPANINFNNPNPHIAWDKSNIEVVSKNMEWKREPNKARLAGIDSFGFGGSNAHVVLMDYQEQESQKTEEKKAYILKISAKSQNSLRNLVNKYVDLLENAAENDIDNILYTANRGRADFGHRAAFTAKSRDELVKNMYAYLQGEKASGVFSSGASAVTAGKIAFMYTGQGSQYINMGRTLYESNAAFQASMDLCDNLFRPYQLKSILSLIYSDEAKEEIVNNTGIAQSLIFSIEYSLGELWRSYGVEPQIVMGHSIGEFAAAVMAGIFSLEAAVQLVACRGRLMADAPGHGTMVTIFASKKRVEQLIGSQKDVVVAVQNAKENCVISGEYDAVMEISTMAEELGIRVRQLKVSHGFHSPLMKGAAEEFKYIAGRTEFHSSRMEFISSMYARKIGENEILDAEYWSKHIMEPVDFYGALESIEDAGEILFLEIGATHTLTSILKLIYDEDRMYCGSLDRIGDDQEEIANALSYMYTKGIQINWNTYYFGQKTNWKRQDMLPTYPFERSPYWQEVMFDRKEAESTGYGENSSLLGQKIETAFLKDTVIFQRVYHRESPYFIKEHIIYDTAIAPAAAYVSILISAMKEIRNPKSISIEDIELRAPLVANEGEKRLVQVCITEVYSDVCYFEIISKLLDGGDDEWITHSKGKISVMEDNYLRPEEEGSVSEWKNLEFEEEKMNPTEHSVYTAMTGVGFNLGEGFCRLSKSLCKDDKGICEINPCKDLGYEEDYIIYPGIIDSVFHTMLCVILKNGFTFLNRPDLVLIPYFISRISFNYVESDKLWCRSDSHVENMSVIGATDVFNEENQMVIQIDNMITRLTNEKNLLGNAHSSGKMFYHYDWNKNNELQIDKRNYNKVYMIMDERTDLEVLQQELQKRKFDLEVLQIHEAGSKLADIITKAKESNEKLLLLYASGAERAEVGMDEEILKNLVEMVQEINRMDGAEVCSIKILTKNVIALGSNENINLQQSVLWGFAKTLGMEFEQMYKGIVDLDELKDSVNISKLADAILYGSSYEVCIRNHTIYTSRLYKHAEYIRSHDLKSKAITVKEDAAYVIAGGTGFLGMTYLDALVDLGAKYIAVLCRKDPDEEFKQRVEELQKEHSLTIRLYLTDICDYSRLEETMLKVKAEMPKIRGIINASGVIRDKMIPDMSWEDFQYVLKPKTIGNINLYKGVESHELDFFIMLSSITAVMGNVGQSNYAAANHFINTFAEYLQSIGKNGFAFCWGPWSAHGMASSDVVVKNMERMGLEAFSKEQGKQLIKEFFANPYQVLMIANIKWEKFIRNSSGEGIRQLLKGLINSENDGKKKLTDSSSVLDLAGKNAKEASELVEARIKASCMNIMGYDKPELIDSNAAFSELGANSLMMFSIRSEINKMLKIDMNVSALYTYPTISKLVHYLVHDMLGIK